MCGRFYRIEDKQAIAEYFHAEAPEDPVAAEPGYNIAPSTTQPHRTLLDALIWTDE